MFSGGDSLPDIINPNNFPAKLWRLVNNPAYTSICWDSLGETIRIDQQLFEKEVLSPRTITWEDIDVFKTTNFSSFVRQLNLYGFRKADPGVYHQPKEANKTFHYFFNILFKQNQPDLVASLRRLTVTNKAKLLAGQKVNCRPPSRSPRLNEGAKVKRESVSPLSSTHLESTHPYHQNKAWAMKAHTGTPIPPRYLIRRHGATLSPAVIAADSPHYPGVASTSNAMHIQQGLLAHGNPNVTSFSPCYQHGFYSPVCHSYHPNLVAPHMAGDGLQAGLFSPHSYQAGYPVNMNMWDHSPNVEIKENQKGKKYHKNSDILFKMEDEVMQTPLNNSLIKVEPLEMSVSVLESSFSTCNTVQCGSTTKAEPPIFTVLSGPCPITPGQQEESVVSVPQQMPEDALFEDTSVEVSDTVGDSSQDQNSSCTGSTSGP